MARKIRGGGFRPVLVGGLLVAALAVVPPTPAAADWLDAERVLAWADGLPQFPQLSGDRLAYTDHVDEPAGAAVSRFDVRVRDLRTRRDLLLTPGRTATGRPAISGDRVVWPDAGDGGAGDAGIRVADLGSGEQRRLAAQPGANVAISGVRLCYEYGGRIWVYDLRTDREMPVSPATATASECDISGTVVVWQDDRNGHDLDVYARALDTGVETRVTVDPADQSLPKVDGEVVVWQDGRGGPQDPDVYAYRLDTRLETRLTAAPGPQSFPDVSDGQVVWMDERFGYGNTEVFTLDLATGFETRVTTGDGWSGNPTISGGRIVYEDVRGAGRCLYERNIAPPALALEVAAGTGVDAPGLSGHLRGVAGVPVVAAVVQLESSRNGRQWLPAGSTTTAGDGSYSFPVPAASGTVWVRVRFAGSPEYAPVSSPTLQVG